MSNRVIFSALLIISFMMSYQRVYAFTFLSGESPYDAARGDNNFITGGYCVITGGEVVEAYKSIATSLEAQGYTCSVSMSNRYACVSGNKRYDSGTYDITCSRTYGTNYLAGEIVDHFTLVGVQDYAEDIQKFTAASTLKSYSGPAGGWSQSGSYASLSFSFSCPVLYFHNPPIGTISTSLSSALDSYLPKPSFNQTNGWALNSKGGILSVGDTTTKHLFYELAVSKITLSRNGRNFSSKSAVVDFLTHSDFLSRMGLTAEEQKNSLEYFLPKLAAAPATSYYYLSALNKESVEEISTLTVIPKPSRVNRQYFALYPTMVPVKTTGDFIFPRMTNESGFTVQETGEFLVTQSMFVFFK